MFYLLRLGKFIIIYILIIENSNKALFAKDYYFVTLGKYCKLIFNIYRGSYKTIQKPSDEIGLKFLNFEERRGGGEGGGEGGGTGLFENNRGKRIKITVHGTCSSFWPPCFENTENNYSFESLFFGGVNASTL